MITFKAFIEEAKNTSYKNIDKNIDRLVNQHEKEIEKTVW